MAEFRDTAPLNGCNKLALCEKFNIFPRATGGTVAAINVPLGTGARGDVFFVRTSKAVKKLRKMGYFDRVTVSLHILYTAN